jgi:hypothetical protein
VTIAVVVVAVIVGGLCVFGVVSFIDQRVREIAVEETERDVSDELARVRYTSAYEALNGLPARLRLFATASDQLAQKCRRDSIAGHAPARMTRDDGVIVYPVPNELRDVAARPGDRTDWQRLDRSLKRLEAIHDQPDAAVHADAHEHVSLAAVELAERLDGIALPIDLDHCWFCDRQIPDVPRLLCSAHASICDDCVRACHDKLQDQDQ